MCVVLCCIPALEDAPFVSPSGQLDRAKGLKQDKVQKANEAKGNKASSASSGSRPAAASRPSESSRPAVKAKAKATVAGSRPSESSRPAVKAKAKAKSRPDRARDPSRSRSPPPRDAPVPKKFPNSTVVPYWTSNKTVGWKVKALGKQVISCSIYPTLALNMSVVEELAEAFEASLDVDAVQAMFAARRARVNATLGAGLNFFTCGQPMIIFAMCVSSGHTRPMKS